LGFARGSITANIATKGEVLKKIHHILIAAMIAAFPLVAQNKQDWQFGAGLSYSVSTGGLGALVFGQKTLADHFALQLSADYDFGGRTDKYDKYVHGVNKWGMDARWIWSLNEIDAPGPVAFASLGFQNATWCEKTDGLYGEAAHLSKYSSTVPKYGVGCGYIFNLAPDFLKGFGVFLVHRFGPEPWEHRQRRY
jgi:hypothetical protein